MNHDSRHARVLRGVQFMDDTKPNWRDEVYIAGFDMSSPDACILGQTFRNSLRPEWATDSGWSAGSYRLGEYIDDHPELVEEYLNEEEEFDETSTIVFGFERDYNEDYEQLAQLWLYHIAGVPVPDELQQD